MGIIDTKFIEISFQQSEIFPDVLMPLGDSMSWSNNCLIVLGAMLNTAMHNMPFIWAE